MNFNLEGKNALVGGSSKGIGKASAIALAELGANVTLVSRSPEIMAAILAQLPRKGAQDHDFLQADFTAVPDLRKKIHTLVAGKPIHILVNNTGGPPAGPITSATADEFLQAYNNHLICNHLITQAVIPGMRISGYGRIINIISTSVKAPLDGLGVSNTVRAAVANWAKTLSNELGPDGITVNNVLPGFTLTERLEEIIEGEMRKTDKTRAEVVSRMEAGVPLRRFADPAEVAAAVAFLASPAASYITGINVPVDGGRTKNL